MKSLARFYLCLLLVVAHVGLGACAHRQVQLTSNPSGASVVTSNNVELEQTPLELSGEKLSQALGSSSYLVLTLRKDGFQDSSLGLEVNGSENVLMNLTPRDKKMFQSRMLGDFQTESHQMISDFLKAQGALWGRKTDLAEKLISKLTAEYPQMASSYVLEADLKLAQGKSDDAAKALAMAKKLAPDDSRIIQAYQALRNRAVASTPPSTPAPAAPASEAKP